MSKSPDDPQQPKAIGTARAKSKHSVARPVDSRAGSSAWSTANLLIICLTVVALAGMALVAYYLFPNPLRECMKAAPQSSSLSVQVPGPGASGTSVGAVLSASTASSGVQSDVQSRTILECLGIATGKETENPNQAAGGPATLGEVMQLWDTTPQGLRIQLQPNQPVLQNFDFGKYKGQKSEVLAMWCKANALCVRCSPDPLTQGHGVVTVSLAQAASAPERTPMDFNKGGWVVSNPPRAYEDIASGVRYSYICPEVKVAP
jgi:hypothetical protein